MFMAISDLKPVKKCTPAGRKFIPAMGIPSSKTCKYLKFRRFFYYDLYTSPLIDIGLMLYSDKILCNELG